MERSYNAGQLPADKCLQPFEPIGFRAASQSSYQDKANPDAEYQAYSDADNLFPRYDLSLTESNSTEVYYPEVHELRVREMPTALITNVVVP